MTDSGQRPANIFQRLRRSTEGLCVLTAFVICVVSSIFMAGILPVENPMGAVGVLFIYFVVMILIGLMLRLLVAIARKLLKRGGTSPA